MAACKHDYLPTVNNEVERVWKPLKHCAAGGRVDFRETGWIAPDGLQPQINRVQKGRSG